jgi:hypothetical protein
MSTISRRPGTQLLIDDMTQFPNHFRKAVCIFPVLKQVFSLSQLTLKVSQPHLLSPLAQIVYG